MTNKEILTTIAQTTDNEEIKAWALNKLELIEANHAKAKERRMTRRNAELDDIVPAILNTLTTEYQTATDICSALAERGITISPQKLAATIKTIDNVEKGTIHFTGKGNRVGYRIKWEEA